jgi:hypothetical protein
MERNSYTRTVLVGILQRIPLSQTLGPEFCNISSLAKCPSHLIVVYQTALMCLGVYFVKFLVL